MFVECYRVAEESDSRVLTGERQVLRNEAYGGDGVPVQIPKVRRMIWLMSGSRLPNAEEMYRDGTTESHLEVGALYVALVVMSLIHLVCEGHLCVIARW